MNKVFTDVDLERILSEFRIKETMFMVVNVKGKDLFLFLNSPDICLYKEGFDDITIIGFTKDDVKALADSIYRELKLEIQ